MSKSNKFSSNVPALEDVTLSFVSEDGTADQEKARKVLHTLMADKAKAQDAREDATAETTEQKSKVTELQKQLDDKSDPDAKAELDKARTAQVKAEGERDQANLRADRMEIAQEKGLTPAQAKRLVGKDREELEADAEELIKDLGIKPGNASDEDEDETDASTTPRSGLTSGGDPKPNDRNSGNVDFEAAAANILGARPF